ncbi:MAG: nitronate monooxygenase [Gammaproteobacteria bacterium]
MTPAHLETPLNALLGLRHPVLLAPMAGVAGGALAAAVSRAGALGLIGGGYCDPEWLGAELEMAGRADIGIGFITWRLDEIPAVLELALAARPRAVLLSFGDITPYVAPIHAAGARVIAQVQSVAQARAARDAGADVIVAQGREAGGHAGERATLALVPAVVDAVAPLPVVAAGGIADGRGLAAVLMLGACGAMLGSRFYACAESLAHPHAKTRAVEASGDDTVRSAAFDRLRGWHWPPGYALRTLANETTRRYAIAPEEFDSRAARERFAAASAAGEVDHAAVIVGEAADLISDVSPAAAVVESIVAAAAAVLDGAGRHLSAARIDAAARE